MNLINKSDINVDAFKTARSKKDNLNDGKSLDYDNLLGKSAMLNSEAKTKK